MGTRSASPTAASLRMRPLYEAIVWNDRESDSLAASCDALMPNLASGEICVGNATCSVGKT